MTRQELFTWIRQQYDTEPEYPWHDWNAVLRHNDNNKWYGVVLKVSADKLGLPEAGIIDVLNVKSDPLLIGSLRGQDGYFPAYHMNKEKWVPAMRSAAGSWPSRTARYPALSVNPTAAAEICAVC